MADKERTDRDTVSCKFDHEIVEIKKCGAIIFEDALLLTGFGKYNYRLLTLSIYTLAAIAEVFSVGIIVTSSQCELDIGVFEKGIISSVPILGAHFWSYLADTRGRLYTLRITIIGTVIGAFISSFANNWEFMTFFKLMSSILLQTTINAANIEAASP